MAFRQSQLFALPLIAEYWSSDQSKRKNTRPNLPGHLPFDLGIGLTAVGGLSGLDSSPFPAGADRSGQSPTARYFRRTEALAPAEEAVAIHRSLAEAQPEAFLPDLANSLDTLAVCFQDLVELAKALEASHESILILAPFFQRLPESYAEWMSGFIKTYRELCGQTGTALDHGLIDPIQAALDSLDG